MKGKRFIFYNFCDSKKNRSRKLIIKKTAFNVTAFGNDCSRVHGDLTTLIDFLLPRYMAEGKANLIISVGCTGGKHRSVAIAEALSEHLRGREYGVVTMHRDYQR